MAAGPAYSTISTYTVTGSTSFTAINLTSIPQNYTDLILVISSGVTNSGISDSDIRVRPNNDGNSIYSSTRLSGSGPTAASARTTGSSLFTQNNTGSGGGTTVRGATTNTFHILNYSNTTTFKTVLMRADNVYGGVLRTSVGLWRSTAAINQLWMDLNFSSSNDWAIGSTFTLYGVTAA